MGPNGWVSYDWPGSMSKGVTSSSSALMGTINKFELNVQLMVYLAENGTLTSSSDSPPSQVLSSSPSSVSISPELGHEYGILPSSRGIEEYLYIIYDIDRS